MNAPSGYGRNANMLIAALEGAEIVPVPLPAPARVAVPDDATITDRYARCEWRGVGVTVHASDGKLWATYVKGERVQRDVIDHTPTLYPDFGAALSDALTLLGAQS
jgi:hypothetical protein